MPEPPTPAPRSWLARLPGETPHEQMTRIRRTCRWCGEEFRTEGIRLLEHEQSHVNESGEELSP